MTDTRSGPASDLANNRGVELSALQHAWLAEIGLERRILARYRRVEPLPVSAGSLPASSGAGTASGRTAGPESKQSDEAGTDLAKIALRQARARPQHAAPASGGLQAVGTHLAQADARQPQVLPADWAALSAHANACQACELHTQRDQLVFGAGDTDQPDWLIVGEAPGKADDRTGLPFQGKAGKLLHAMLVAVGVHPASLVLGAQAQAIPAWSQPTRIYFANLVKCRPLGNRSPAPSEIASCVPYLMQQIEVLQPRRILALGRLAAQALLQVDADVDELRGRLHYLSTAAGTNIPLVVTWHPAALLMHPQNKGQAWADLNRARHIAT